MSIVAVFGNNVAICGNNVAGFGNNVERNFVLSTKSKCSISFDFVERTKFRSTLLRFVATKSNVASTMLPVALTLLLVWTGP